MIYCNGDSFTAGDELGDDIIPGHPGLLDYDSPPSIRKIYCDWTSNSHNHNTLTGVFRKQNLKNLINLGLQRSWPTKLGHLLETTVVNNANSGASMDQIARTTVVDLLRLIKTNKDITVFIGLTSEVRFEVGQPFDHWYSVLPQNSDIAPNKDTAAIAIAKTVIETDYHNLVNFYKNVIYIKDFCAIHDIKIYFLSPFSLNKATEERCRVHTDLKEMVEYADLKCELIMLDVAAKLRTGVYCSAGHFSETVHDEVARLLYEKIIK